MESGGLNSSDMCGNRPEPGGIQNLIEENPELGRMLLSSTPHEGSTMNRPPALCTPAIELESAWQGRQIPNRSTHRQCPLCLKYLTILNFTRHFQQEKKKKYCKSCKCQFDDIAEHVEEKHAPMDPVPFYGRETRLCRVCGRRYVTEHRYAAHMLAQHGTAVECSQQISIPSTNDLIQSSVTLPKPQSRNQCQRSPSVYDTPPVYQGPGLNLLETVGAMTPRVDSAFRVPALPAAIPHQQSTYPLHTPLNSVQCPLCLLDVHIDQIREHFLAETMRNRRYCRSCSCSIGSVREHLRRAHSSHIAAGEMVQPVGSRRNALLKLMRCDICSDVTFVQVDLLANHIRKSHPVNMKAQCIFCLKSLRHFTPKEIRAHSDSHIRRWCVHCAKQISGNISEHLADKHGYAKATCDVCGLILPVGRVLMNHFKLHYAALLNTNCAVIVAKRSSSKCDICGYVVSGYYQHTLWSHIQVVHGLVSLYCDICNKKFKNHTNLSRHVGYAHLSHVFNYTCPICKEIVVPTSWTAPIKHSCTLNPLTLDGPRRKPFQFKFADRYCDICGKKKIGAHQTKDHIFSVHLGIRKPKPRFLCIICGKLISTSIKKYHLEKTHRDHRPVHV